MFDQLYPSQHTPLFLNQVRIEARSYWNCTASETVRAGCVRCSTFTTGHKSSLRAGGQWEGKKKRKNKVQLLFSIKDTDRKCKLEVLTDSYFRFREQKK